MCSFAIVQVWFTVNFFAPGKGAQVCYGKESVPCAIFKPVPHATLCQNHFFSTQLY